MKIAGYDNKFRMGYGDSSRVTPTSRWGQNMDDLYRKTNKNLTNGVYV